MLKRDLVLEPGRTQLPPLSTATNPTSRVVTSGSNNSIPIDTDDTIYGHSTTDLDIDGLDSAPPASPSDYLDSDVFYGKNSYDDLILKYSEQYGVDPLLIKCMVQQESSFNPNAQSPYACGLMQLSPETAAALGVTDIYDPEQNIAAGVKYFAQLLKQFDNNETLALAAYNAGPGNVKKYGNTIPPYAETLNHVKVISETYKKASGGQFSITELHTWTEQEKENVRAGIIETYGSEYAYNITYNNDGTYNFDIINSSGKKMDPQEVLKGYDKPLVETKPDLSEDIPDDAKILPNGAGDDTKLQAGLSWVYDTFTDDEGNFNAQGFTDWVNGNYGDGSAYNYSGDDVGDVLAAAQNAESSGDWAGFWDSLGGYGGSGGGGHAGYGGGYYTGGFDVFSTGGGNSSGSASFDAFCDAMRDAWYANGPGSSKTGGVDDRRQQAQMMQVHD